MKTSFQHLRSYLFLKMNSYLMKTSYKKINISAYRVNETLLPIAKSIDSSGNPSEYFQRELNQFL